MKRRILAAAAAGLAAFSIGAAAHAQTAAGQVDPARLALARQVIEASGGAKGAEAQMQSLFGTIFQGMARNMPPDQARLQQQIGADMQAEVTKMMPQIMDISAKAFASNLTDQELRDMLAFYRTESGQAMIHKLPLIMQQAARDEVPLLQAMMPEMLHKTIDDVCEQTKCTPQVRQMMTEAMAKALQRPAS